MTVAKNVTARLTDPSKYTVMTSLFRRMMKGITQQILGAHKERFDESGKGKGIAGRQDVVNYNGSTSSATRDHTVKETKVEKANKPVVKAKTSEETYGVTARKITLFQYADKNHAGDKVVLTKQKFPSMKQMQDIATKMIPTGKAKLILEAGTMKEIKSLDDFVDGGKYMVITSFDKAKMDESKIPQKFKEN
ncbi:hypothetical protein HK102_006831 [Quaeritorhiza haematococci]|nr:hypothetical protein HK102_006831 [Quaeritorhiza haematococci]